MTTTTLIPCADCGTDISPRATSCPKCGNPVNQRQPTNRSTHERTFAENLNARAILIGIMIVFLIYVAITHAT